MSVGGASWDISYILQVGLIQYRSTIVKVRKWREWLLQALEVPQAVGVKQGIMQGITVGFTNLTFLCSYALAFWYGSTRVHAGAYDGAPLPLLAELEFAAPITIR